MENFSRLTEGGGSPKKDYRRKDPNYAHQMQLDHIKREKDLEQIKIQNLEKLEYKEKLKPKIEEIRIKLEEFKGEYNILKNKLLLHYHKILIEGTDTRSEGLIWIIKAIWNLGNNVIMYYIPTYLDERCIDFLFSTAHKEFSLQKIKSDIEDVRAKLKSRLQQLKNNKSKSKNMNNTFKTETKVNLS